MVGITTLGTPQTTRDLLMNSIQCTNNHLFNISTLTVLYGVWLSWWLQKHVANELSRIWLWTVSTPTNHLKWFQGLMQALIPSYISCVVTAYYGYIYYGLVVTTKPYLKNQRNSESVLSFLFCMWKKSSMQKSKRAAISILAPCGPSSAHAREKSAG